MVRATYIDTEATVGNTGMEIKRRLDTDIQTQTMVIDTDFGKDRNTDTQT